MKKKLLLATSGLVAASLLTLTQTASTDFVNAYVGIDRDGSKGPSSGDQIRWFVQSSSDIVVKYTCWTSIDKTTQTLTYTSPKITGPSSGFGTSFGFDQPSGGYCESFGQTSAGSTAVHFMSVRPYRLPAPYTDWP